MSYIVKIQRACGCFIKHDLDESVEFKTLQEAQTYASEICTHMNRAFCKAHRFTPMEEKNGEIVLKVLQNPKRL